MQKQNDFIDILTKAYGDKEVMDVINKYKMDKPEQKPKDDIVWSGTESGFVNLTFSDNYITPEQQAHKTEGKLYLNSMSFDFHPFLTAAEKVDVPFGIHKEMTFKDLVALLGEAEYMDDNYSEEKKTFRQIWVRKKEDGTRYSIVVRFDNDEAQKVNHLGIFVDDDSTEYRIVPNTLKPL